MTHLKVVNTFQWQSISLEMLGFYSMDGEFPLFCHTKAMHHHSALQLPLVAVTAVLRLHWVRTILAIEMRSSANPMSLAVWLS